MMCHAPNCARPKGTFSNYCARHKQTYRRHGHPLQRGVRRAELEPYLKRVRRRMEANSGSPLWGHAEARWRTFLDGCEGILEAYEAGKPGVRWEIQAVRVLLRLAGEVEPRAVVETVSAMFLMQTSDPRRFLSDEAFRVQLARRVLRLSDIHIGTSWNNATGRAHRWYRDLPPRVAQVLGRCLAETLGVIGLRIAQLEQKEADAKAQANHDFRAALAALN